MCVCVLSVCVCGVCVQSVGVCGVCVQSVGVCGVCVQGTESLQDRLPQRQFTAARDDGRLAVHVEPH